MSRAPSTAGECIRAWRELRGMSYRELGRKAGISAGYLCDIEKGRKTLGFDRVARICRALRLEPHRLVQHMFDDMLPRRLRLDVIVYDTMGPP